jgi:hypothetical protein
MTERWREFRTAAETPASWWPPLGTADPRRTRAWATATRWPGDKISYVGGMPDGPFAAIRRFTPSGGWSRMDAVEVCGGLFRQVEQDPATIAAARAAGAHQLVLATVGYTNPIWASAWDERVLELLAHCRRLAPPDALTAILHIEHDSPLTGLLRAAGWQVGVTDLYPAVDPIGRDRDEWLAGMSSKRRISVKRDMRRLGDAGGVIQLLRGKDILPLLRPVAALEAEAERQHNGTADASMLSAVNEDLVAGFGDLMTMVVVRDADDEPVASCSTLSGGGAVLCRNAGLREPGARALGAYFHACYYGPLDLGWANGDHALLLGPGSLAPKLLRGARPRPLVSAVPPDSPAVLRRLLQVTDQAIRGRAQDLGWPVPVEAAAADAGPGGHANASLPGASARGERRG